MDVNAEFAVHFDVGPGGVGVALSEEEHPAGLDEACVAPYRVAKIVEDVAGFHRHLDKCRVQIVLAHHRAGASTSAAGEVSLFDENDLARAHAGEVHGDAGPVDAAAYDDYVCRSGGHVFLSVFSS